MTQENVEIVRGNARAVNDGDTEYVIRHTTEDVVLLMARSAVARLAFLDGGSTLARRRVLPGSDEKAAAPNRCLFSA